MKYCTLLILLHLPIVTLGAETCKEDRHYKEFYELKKTSKREKKPVRKLTTYLKTNSMS